MNLKDREIQNQRVVKGEPCWVFFCGWFSLAVYQSTVFKV